MSEIKGSLLTIILTIAVFGVVLAAVGGAFTAIGLTTSERMESAIETTYVVPAPVDSGN